MYLIKYNKFSVLFLRIKRKKKIQILKNQKWKKFNYRINLINKIFPVSRLDVLPRSLPFFFYIRQKM